MERITSKLVERKCEDQNGQIMVSEDELTSTPINRKVNKLVWVIKNFSKHLTAANNGDFIESRIFYTGYSDEHAWRLNFYPNGDLAKRQGVFYLYIKSVDGPIERKVTLIPQVSIIRKDEKVTHQASWVMGFERSQAFGGPLGFKQSFTDRPDHYLPDDTLTISITMEVQMEEKSCTKLKLFEDLKKLFGDEKYSDYSLNVKGKIIKVHKNILAVRSSYFQALFESCMTESQKNEVNIEDTSYEVTIEMLRYIYTGRIQGDSCQLLIDLMAAADKYHVNGLLTVCERGISNRLTVDNAFEVLDFATIHNASELRSKAIDFISANLKGVIESVYFQCHDNLKHKGDLLADVLRNVASKKSESVK